MAADAKLQLQQWKADVWYWRFWGVALYDLIIVCPAVILYAAFSATPWHASVGKVASSVMQPWTWVRLLSVCAAQILVVSGGNPPLNLFQDTTGAWDTATSANAVATVLRSPSASTHGK